MPSIAAGTKMVGVPEYLGKAADVARFLPEVHFLAQVAQHLLDKTQWVQASKPWRNQQDHAYQKSQDSHVLFYAAFYPGPAHFDDNVMAVV
jgi:hypothetical protein